LPYLPLVETNHLILSDRQRSVLRLLVARCEAYDNVSLQHCRLDWLTEGGVERDDVISICDSLIELGLAETSGILVRALQPQAGEALSFHGQSRRLSGLALT
jgi:hypothetical protein